MISKIFHLSDIHIRIYDRHDEYKETFDRVFDSITNNKDNKSIIVVTGDIVHSKLNTSPEMFDVLRYFLDSLSNILPTYIILGNHDLNLKNKSRLDPITPVVKSLNKKTLNILRGTKHHQLKEGLDVSLLDVVEGPDNFQVSSSMDTTYPLVAIYHGIVTGAIGSTGFELDGEVDVDLFYGFDAVLLGDVHKHQHIKNNIIYPGSLIQQNFGEHPINHGYVLWSWDSKNNKFNNRFIQVNNNHSFIVLDLSETIHSILNKVNDSVHEDTKEVSMSFRNYNMKPPAVIHDIIYDLKKKYKIRKIEKIRTEESSVSIDINKINNYSFSDKTNSQRSIEQYIDNKFNVSKRAGAIIKDKVYNLIKDYKGWNLSSTDKVEILDYTFSNMFSYGPLSKNINFSNIKGLVGIFAENASGKSTFFDSLCYTIFGKCGRTSKASEVINSSMDHFRGEVVLLKGGVKYKILKEGSRSDSGRVSVKVTFYKEDDKGDFISVTGQDRIKTEKLIKEVFGEYEDFVHTSYYTQSNNINFINIGQAKRKSLLSYYLNLDLFSEWHDTLKDEYKKLKNILDYEDLDQYKTFLISLKESVQNIENLLKSSENELEKLEKNKSKIKEKINKLREEIKPVDKSIINVDINNIEVRIQRRISIIENSLKNKINDLKDKERILERDLDSKVKNIDKFTVTESPKSDIRDIENKIKQINNNVKTFEGIINKLKKSIEYYDNLEYDPDCDYCVKNLNLSNLEDQKLDLREYTTKVGLLLEERKKLESSLEPLREDLREYEMYYKVKQEIVSLRESIAHIKKSIIDYNEEIESSQEEIEEYRQIIKKHEDNKEFLHINESVKEKIDIESKKLKTTEDSIKDLIYSESSSRAKLNNHKEKIKEYEEKVKELSKIEEEVDSLYYLVKTTHRDGLPLEIMSNALPFIESTVNKVLGEYVDFRVEVINNGKKVDVNMKYKDGTSWDSSLCSGMETFLLSLAFKIALSQLTTLNKYNLLIIDEGFGSLDFEKRSSIEGFLTGLKNYYDGVFCISHIDNMKDFMDKVLIVEKDNNLSNIYLSN